MNERFKKIPAALFSALLIVPTAGAALASDATEDPSASLTRVMWIVLAIWLALGT